MQHLPSPIPLGSESLDRLPPDVAVPTYPRGRLRRSIVHLGVGGFHRSHLATYVDDLCRAGHQDWSIVGAGVLAGDAAMAAALLAQDGLYTLITRGPTETRVRVIGSIVEYIHASPDSAPLVDAITNPATQVVSLTVTEGGYPVDDTTGEFQPDSRNAGAGSAFGLLVAGLDRRRRQDIGGLTVISCDNIVSNGVAARTATVGEAARVDSDLAAWIETSVAFPNSMVDRITPATTDADRSWLTDTHGIADQWPVVTEPFRQWVIEDSFAADRLPLEDLDVLVTNNVEPYEIMKLRLLNATHSALAYLSALLGYETVDAALADPDVREFTAAFLDCEARPALPPVNGIDLEQYTASVIERFSNPNIGDQIARLCLDGSAKFPKFLLPTVHAQLGRGGSIELSALALAGWCQYLTGPSESLSADPNLESAVAYARRSEHDPGAFLAFPAVFGDDLRASPRFVGAFVDALHEIRERGVRSAISTTINRT